MTDYNKTFKGLVSKIYSHQKDNSYKRGHSQPSYTKKELMDWIISQETFYKLYFIWVESDHSVELKPSVDRIDDNIGYTMENIQLMTWDDNREKAYQSLRDGLVLRVKHKYRPVVKYSDDGYVLSEFSSIQEASRETGIYNGSITKVCKGERKLAGGFIWKYKTVSDNSTDT